MGEDVDDLAGDAASEVLLRFDFGPRRAAVSLFGLNSGAALATVVGVLIEVPVMLSVVRIVNRTRPWYERRVGQDVNPPERSV